MSKQSRRNVIIKEYDKTSGTKLLSAEQIDGEYAKMPSSIIWRHEVRSPRQNKES